MDEVSGESILSMIVGIHEIELEDYITIFLSFGIIYTLKDVYFNNLCEQKGHALSEHLFPGKIKIVLLVKFASFC